MIAHSTHSLTLNMVIKKKKKNLQFDLHAIKIRSEGYAQYHTYACLSSHSQTTNFIFQIRYYFYPNATEENGIATVNLNHRHRFIIQKEKAFVLLIYPLFFDCPPALISSKGTQSHENKLLLSNSFITEETSQTCAEISLLYLPLSF